MRKSKTIDRVCCVATAVMLLAATLLWGVVEPVRGDGSHTVGYEILFDQGYVHQIDITMADWDSFIANATAEEYAECSIVVDGEKFNNVGIRAKGNTSLSSVAAMGSTRYSFKVEFDHYVKGMTYHGLDKLSLNNLIQDATMMKDYLSFTLMNRMGVPSSLCSYAQINVNGEPWGLYLAVEGVEDAFLDRNGLTRGDLYKPDSLSFGGGRGNGRDFDFENFRVRDTEAEADRADSRQAEGDENVPAQEAQNDSSFGGSADFAASGGQSAAGDGTGSFGGSAATGTDLGGFTPPEGFTVPDGFPMPGNDGEGDGESRGFGNFNFGMGSSDVRLIYTDDDPDSYTNIFENAKTKVTKADKARLIEALRRLNAREELDTTVNRDEVLRYLAVHHFVCNDDSYTGMMVHNYYLYEEKGQLSIIPWDYNLAFGGFSVSADATSTVNSPIDSPVSGGSTDDRPLVAWIFDSEEDIAAYHAVYDEFITKNLENGWLAGEIDRVAALITPCLEADESKFYDMDAFETAIGTLQRFCALRGESIRGQLNGDIPSTSEGQRLEADRLIDASDVNTALMGSMNGNTFSDAGNGNIRFGNGSAPAADGETPAAAGSDNGASFGGSSGGSSGAQATAQPNGAEAPTNSDQGAAVPPDGAQQPEASAGDSAANASAGGTAAMPENGQQPAPSDGNAQFNPSDGAQTTQPETTGAAATTEIPQPAGSQQPDSPGENPPDSAQPAENPTQGDFSRQRDFPGMDLATPQQQENAIPWGQLGLWTAVLLLGLVIAKHAANHN